MCTAWKPGKTVQFITLEMFQIIGKKSFFSFFVNLWYCLAFCDHSLWKHRICKVLSILSHLVWSVRRRKKNDLRVFLFSFLSTNTYALLLMVNDDNFDISALLIYIYTSIYSPLSLITITSMHCAGVSLLSFLFLFSHGQSNMAISKLLIIPLLLPLKHSLPLIVACSSLSNLIKNLEILPYIHHHSMNSSQLPFALQNDNQSMLCACACVYI